MTKASNHRKKERRQIQRDRQKQMSQAFADTSIDTVQQAVEYLLAQLDQEMIDALKSGTEEEANRTAYLNLGMGVRAQLGLWHKQNINLLRSCGDENMFADNASAVILEAFVRRLRADAPS